MNTLAGKVAIVGGSSQGIGYAISRRLAGDGADVALVAYTRFAHQADIDLGNYPNVRAWVHRIEDDLRLEHLS